jgi:hypothetical protein
MGDGNLKQQGLVPLGKFATSFNPTHLEVEVSPGLYGLKTTFEFWFFMKIM